MSRTLRIEFPGAIYHVTCRLVGSWQARDRDLFVDDADRWRFLDALGTRVEAFGVRLHQYVLMQNHFFTWSPKHHEGTARPSCNPC